MNREQEKSIKEYKYENELIYLLSCEGYEFIRDYDLSIFDDRSAQEIANIIIKTNDFKLIDFLLSHKLTIEKIHLVRTYWNVIHENEQLLNEIIKDENIKRLESLIILVTYQHDISQYLGQNIVPYYLENLVINEKINQAVYTLSQDEINVIQLRTGEYHFNSENEEEIIYVIKAWERHEVSLDMFLHKYFKFGSKYSYLFTDVYKKIEPLVEQYYENRELSETNQTPELIVENNDIEMRLYSMAERIIEKIEYQIKVNSKVALITGREKRGLTLEEVGQIYHLTRERVRQIEQGVLNKIDGVLKQINPPNAHLGLSRLSEKVLGLKMDFKAELKVPSVYQNKFLRKVYHLEEDNYFYLGEIVPRNRRNLFNVFVKNLDFDQYHISEIEEQFIASLVDAQILDQSEIAELLESREILGRLTRTEEIIKSTNFRFRKWSGDINILVKEITPLLKNQKDIFSSRILFLAKPSLMKRCDIRDYYELHYIMKKHKNKFENLEFLRTPHISIGKQDMYEFIMNYTKMYDLERSELAKLIETETGISAETIIATYFTSKEE